RVSVEAERDDCEMTRSASATARSLNTRSASATARSLNTRSASATARSLNTRSASATARSLNRRLAAGIFLICFPVIALALQAPGEIQTLKVQGNVYLLTGAGGNIAVQVGDAGVVVVDTGLAETGDKVIAAIRKLSDKPIQYIIN